MAADVSELYLAVQRGLLRVGAISEHGVLYEETPEGARVRQAFRHRAAIRCEGCNSEYPTACILPKYSKCPACRANDPKVDFIERPS
jgi:Zn finger protein HypA/HybF involved in hydrogenase expression